MGMVNKTYEHGLVLWLTSYFYANKTQEETLSGKRAVLCFRDYFILEPRFRKKEPQKKITQGRVCRSHQRRRKRRRKRKIPSLFHFLGLWNGVKTLPLRKKAFEPQTPTTSFSFSSQDLPFLSDAVFFRPRPTQRRDKNGAEKDLDASQRERESYIIQTFLFPLSLPLF